MLSIDLRDARPIYEQIADGIEQMAMHGIYQPDEQLPSVRQLAMELSINPNTIQRAYAELEHRKVTYSVKGKGSFISKDCQQLRIRKLSEIKKQLRNVAEQAVELGASRQQLIEWIQEKGE